jgi:hypothetical protein
MTRCKQPHNNTTIHSAHVHIAEVRKAAKLRHRTLEIVYGYVPAVNHHDNGKPHANA